MFLSQEGKDVYYVRERFMLKAPHQREMNSIQYIFAPAVIAKRGRSYPYMDRSDYTHTRSYTNCDK